MNDNFEARAVLSEMTEITERTISQTFHRDTDLDALYRACPTAFWLAPDGDGVLPPPPPGPIMPPPTRIEYDDAVREPVAVHGRLAAMGRAVIVAGPIFAATALVFLQNQVDRYWWEPFGRALMSLIALPLTVIVGAVLAFAPVLVGVATLGRIGATLPVVRAPAAWTLVGGAMGVAIAALFDAGGSIGLALVATSAACARIARTGMDWIDPDCA